MDNSSMISLAKSRLDDDDSVKNRCKMLVGDCLQEIPTGYDYYLLFGVLHRLDDESVEKLLTQLVSAMSSVQVKVYIVEPFMGEDNDVHVREEDIRAMVRFGGRVRTQEQYEGLLGSVGLYVERINPIYHTKLQCMTCVRSDLKKLEPDSAG